MLMVMVMLMPMVREVTHKATVRGTGRLLTRPYAWRSATTPMWSS
jgi:hypothetical protein